MKRPSKSRKAARPASRVLLAVHTYAAYQREMVQGVLNYARSLGMKWEFEFTVGNQTMLEKIERAGPCEAAIAHVDTGDPATLAALRDRRVPTVLIEGYKQDEFPGVMGDNRAIGRMAFEHLRSKGFRRYVYLGWVNGLFLDREEGFATSVREADLQLLDPLAVDSYGDLERDPRAIEWIMALPKPVAMFAVNVSQARQVIDLCRKLGVLVPEEIAVLGVTNEPLECDLSQPPISAVDHGMEHAGYEAAALLHRLISGRPAPAKPILVPPVSVVERQSTDTLAVDDPDVRAAVRLIREHAATGLTVKELLGLLPVTRRKIEIGFRKFLGRSIHQEMTRVRLDRAKLLLTTTEMSMPEVAAACGMQESSRLSELFSQAVGSTPTAYRRTFRRG